MRLRVLRVSLNINFFANKIEKTIWKQIPGVSKNTSNRNVFTEPDELMLRVNIHRQMFKFFRWLPFIDNQKYLYSQIPNNRPPPHNEFLKNFRNPSPPPPPQLYSNSPSPPIINFVISKSLFQNLDSISIKTYAKFL